MSAGAAMAVILGATYPDLYAAVGAHSGLAYGAAHDMPSAFGAMRGGSGLSRAASQAAIAAPTIVFHGDGDHTVDARNATTIVEQTIARHDHATLRVDARTGTAAGDEPIAVLTTSMRRTASWRSTGHCTAPAMRGRVGAQRDLSRTREAPTRRAK